MNKTIRLLLVAVLTCRGFFMIPLHAADEVKVVTWNMRWFPGGSPQATAEEKQVQMARAKAVLQKINPDIFLCEEVASWGVVKEVTSPVPGLRPVVVSNFGRATDDTPPQNVGIATKLPVISGWAETWKDEAGWTENPLPRGFAFAAIELPDHSLLLVYAVHLKSNHRTRDISKAETIAMREESSRLLRQHICKMRLIYGKAYPKLAVLVGGDFNTSLDDVRFKKEQTLRALIGDGFRWGFEGTPSGQRITIPNYGGKGLPAVTFDHFFLLGRESTPAHVLGGAGVSDHLPVEIILSGK